MGEGDVSKESGVEGVMRLSCRGAAREGMRRCGWVRRRGGEGKDRVGSCDEGDVEERKL